MEIIIDPKFKWAAMDSNGEAYFYANKPYISEHGRWRGDGSILLSSRPFSVNLGPWRESLHQIIDNKLVKYVDIPAKDEPVLVSDLSTEQATAKRHSAGKLNNRGSLLCYAGGKSAWTNDCGLTPWIYWRRPTPEELEDRA